MNNSQLSNIKGRYALILGSSSGFGKAISLVLAKRGMNILGVHLDRKATLPLVQEQLKEIQSFGVGAHFFNVNAADPDRRKEVVNEVAKLAPEGIHCLVHSLAFGTLKPFISKDEKDSISRDQMDMTLDVMAHSLVYWVQELYRQSLLQKGAKIFAMTSAGSTRVWSTYGAVSAAKASLESHCRQLSLELAPHSISVNAIRAGVTDTPALRKIPGHEQMIELALSRNPAQRLTSTEDVASVISLLVHDECRWVTGNVIGVDGGEDIVG